MYLNFALFSCRIKSAEKQYIDAFEDELQSFIKRVETRAKVRIEEAMKEYEEEEKKKRLGPGGLDPLEVIETLPPVRNEAQCCWRVSIYSLRTFIKIC